MHGADCNGNEGQQPGNEGVNESMVAATAVGCSINSNGHYSAAVGRILENLNTRCCDNRGGMAWTTNQGGLSGETRLRELLVGSTLNSMTVKSKQDIENDFRVQLRQEEYIITLIHLINKLRRELPAHC